MSESGATASPGFWRNLITKRWASDHFLLRLQLTVSVAFVWAVTPRALGFVTLPEGVSALSQWVGLGVALFCGATAVGVLLKRVWGYYGQILVDLTFLGFVVFAFITIRTPWTFMAQLLKWTYCWFMVSGIVRHARGLWDRAHAPSANLTG